VAISIDSSAAIRGVCSDSQPPTLLDVLTVEIEDTLPVAQTIGYNPSIFSSTLSITSHSLKCRLPNLHYQ